MLDTLKIIYVIYLIIISLITFIAYFLDKKKAQARVYRTKEVVLLGLSFIGGAFGGFPSMLIFRHKTKLEHWYFTFVNVLGILIHTACLIYLYFII